MGNTFIEMWNDTLLFKWKLFEMERHENLDADLLNILVQHFNVTR